MPFLRQGNIAIRLSLIGVLFFYFFYNVPFLYNVSVSKNSIHTLFDKGDGLYYPIIRSSLFAFLQSILSVAAGLLLSILLIAIPLFSKLGRFLSVLLLPVILGNVSVAFIWKLLLFNTNVPFEDTITKFLTLGFIQYWEYGTLFIYLFWLNQHTITTSTWDYANSIHLTPMEKVRDVILPKQRNLATLLFIVGFIFSYYEDAKIQFIFKASRGTDTELVNQWLNRTYQSDTLLGADFAFNHIAQLGIMVLIIALLSLALVIFLKSRIYKVIITFRKSFFGLITYTPAIAKVLAVFIILLTATPLIVVLIMQFSSFQLHLTSLTDSLFLTFIAAFLATIFSIVFTIINRIVLKKILADFNSRSLSFIIALFTMTLIPPIIVLILGFKWMQIVGYASSYTIFVAWILGHILLSFPLLSGFSLATHFRVKNSSIEYLNVHRIPFLNKVRDLFFMPFRLDYLLTFIIAYALIWNEAIINNVLSDIIPSFITELNKTISGKSIDYGNGMNYLLISICLAVLSILLWNNIMGKGKQKQEV